MKFKQKTGQKDSTSYFIVLTVEIHSIFGIDSKKRVNGVECDDKFIEWQVGIVLKTEMMYITLFWSLQYHIFNSLIVFILTNIPNLKLPLTNMLHQRRIILQIRKINMIYVGYNFDYAHLILDVFFDFVIVLCDILCDFCCF